MDRTVYRVSFDFPQDGIRLLIADPDPEDDQGYYLYLLPTLSASEFADMYFQSIGELKKFCRETYQLGDQDWSVMQDKELKGSG
jgi:hypothetical protein